MTFMVASPSETNAQLPLLPTFLSSAPFAIVSTAGSFLLSRISKTPLEENTPFVSVTVEPVTRYVSGAALSVCPP